MRSDHPAIPYIRELYAREDALLIRINEALAAKDRSWQVGAEEGRILQLLIAMHGAKTVVEVGTLFGYSAIWMARALPKDGKLISIDRDAEHHEAAKKFIAESDVKDKVELLCGDAVKALESLNDRAPFDMIFIDADKPGYVKYLDWAERNIRKGGVIVADNTLLFGAVYQDAPPEGTAPSTWKFMREFNKRLADISKYQAVMLPTDQGLSVAVKLL